MYNMYHGHAPSYLCDLLLPLVRDVTNYPVRNRNDHCPKMSLIVIPIFVHPVCHKSLEQSWTTTPEIPEHLIHLKLTLKVKLYWLKFRLIS